jgi:threonine-phosphate decarboxylase
MKTGHGSDRYLYKTDIVADFSSNVWYQGMPRGLFSVLEEELTRLEHYPEPNSETLTAKLARHHGLSEKQVLVSNGATEAFYLLAHLFARKPSVIITPSFAEYEDSALIFEHSLTYLSNTSLTNDTVFPPGSVIWAGNPNNPDSFILPAAQILAWCRRNPASYFIIDEAYSDLCYQFESVIPFIKELDNLIVTASLTKAFAIPGLRLGYLLAPEKIIQSINRLKMPWNINSLAMAAGHYILDNYAAIKPDLKLLQTESLHFYQQLSQLSFLQVAKSATNYFLIKLKSGESGQLKQWLLDNYGILIRDAANFRGLNNSYVRVSVQSRENNQALIRAFIQWANL